MSNATHTPGPWHRETQNNVFAVLDERDRLVCSTANASHHMPVVERAENARLIAAAPELLEALRNLLEYANRYSDKMAEIGRGAEQLGELADSVSVAGMARAAIGKATGGAA